MDTQKTYIISGNFRGGTTAVAQLLAQAGIYLGEEMDSHGNSEDSAFQRLLVKPDLDSDELVRLIESRNHSHPIWGFKFPGAHTFMPGMLPYFRNPRLLFVFRDPIAVADSECRRAGQDFGDMMHRTARFNSNMVELMKLLPNRSHGVSYELLLAHFTGCRKSIGFPGTRGFSQRKNEIDHEDQAVQRHLLFRVLTDQISASKKASSY